LTHPKPGGEKEYGKGNKKAAYSVIKEERDRAGQKTKNERINKLERSWADIGDFSEILPADSQ